MKYLLLAATMLSVGCGFQATDDGAHFTFPLESEGDHLDPDGAWRGSRKYRGSKGAWVETLTEQPCDTLSYHINWKEVQILSKAVPGTSTNTIEFTMKGNCDNPITPVELVVHESED